MSKRRNVLALLSLTFVGTAFAPSLRAQQASSTSLVVSTLRGRITEVSDSSMGVRGAEIELVGEGRRVYTDSGGRYILRGVSPGVYTVLVRLMGYKALRHRIELDRNDVDLGRWPLPRLAASLAEVRINGTMRRVPARFEEVYARAARGFGTFIGREELDKLPLIDVKSVLMRVPSVRVNDRGISFPRCNDYIGATKTGDVVSIYIDGTRMYPPAGGGGFGASMNDVLRLVAVKDIQAIEVFKGVAQLPAEFNNDACAVVAIWTRSY